jgi:hypothetical protein
MKKTGNTLLKFKFDGTSIHDGRILYDDLSTFISNITLAVDRIINKIRTGESIKKGRPFKETQVLSALEIVSIRRGSFMLGLDLRRNGNMFPGLDVGEEAIFKLMVGLHAIECDKPLPPEYDYGVLKALRDAGKIMDRGVDSININSTTSLGRKKATYTLPVRRQIETKISRYEYGLTIVEGRLVMLDMEEDKLRCRLRPSVGEPFLCSYDEDLSDQIEKYLRKFVRVRGDAIFDKETGKILNLNIKDLESIEESSASTLPPSPLSSFWVGKSFEQLTSEQAIYPIDDIKKLSGDWPEDEDFDDFLKAVRSSRS